METTIKMARACKTSAELFAMAESLSQALSDSEAGLERAELDYNWDAISHYVGMVAHWKYLYKTIYGWASDMEEDEHELELSREYHDAMMGDRM
jgi:hypothetical protein